MLAKVAAALSLAFLGGCDHLFGVLEVPAHDGAIVDVRPDGLPPCFGDDFNDNTVDGASWVLLVPANAPARVEEANQQLQSSGSSSAARTTSARSCVPMESSRTC